MSLANLKFPTRLIKVGDSEIEFHGLSFNDITLLIEGHKESLDQILVDAENFMGNSEGQGSIQEFVVGTLIKLPDLCSSVIAVAAGEPEMAHAAKRISFPTQVKILNEVFALTFEEVGGVGKFVELVILILSSTTDLIENHQNTGTDNSDHSLAG